MLVVVGGHARRIGKSSVVAALIGKLRDLNWTAVKITQHGHGAERDEGAGQVMLVEEFQPNQTDSGRFLAAGAIRSFWLRTPPGEIGRAMPSLHPILNRGGNTILESNSIVEFVTPDLFLMVLDFSRSDFKPSSLRFADRADAFVVIERGDSPALESGELSAAGAMRIAGPAWEAKPRFPVNPPDYVTDALADLVRGGPSAPSR